MVYPILRSPILGYSVDYFSDDDFEGELGEEDSQDGEDKSQHHTGQYNILFDPFNKTVIDLHIELQLKLPKVYWNLIIKGWW